MNGLPLVTLSMVALLGLSPTASAQTEVDLQVFQDALAPYGHWVEVETYGRVWYPVGMPAGWRPYTDGHWSWTEDYGWTWVSDWDWGWAPFHYGSWEIHPIYGWIWIPDTVWAPAWVVWRSGHGYAGWAPLPHRFRHRPGGWTGFDGSECDRTIDVHAWVFVEEHRLLEPRLRTVVVQPSANVTILRRHANRFTGVEFRNRHIYNPGLPVQRVEAVTHAQVPRLRVVETDRPSGRRPEIQGPDRLHVYKPMVRPRPLEPLPRETAPPARMAPRGRPAAGKKLRVVR